MDLSRVLNRLERQKNSDLRGATWRLAYGGLRLSRLVLGDVRSLKLLLDLAWIARRLAFEQSVRVGGDKFTNYGLALSEDWLADNLEHDDRVLDVGCGTGRLAQRVSPLVREVVGVDHDQAAIEVAMSRGVPNARFVHHDLSETIPHLGRFDLALLSHVLEHIDDPVELLQALHEHTERLLIEVPDVESDPLNFARLMTRRPLYTDADHAREYTEGTLGNHLARAGWCIRRLSKASGSIVAIAEPMPAASIADVAT